MKIKNCVLVTIVALLSCLSISNVSALEKRYSTVSPNKVSKFIEKAPSELVELYKEGNLTITDEWFDENGELESDIKVLTKYFETTTNYKNGVAISSENKEITKDEYDSFEIEKSTNGTRAVVGNCNLQSGVYNDCWETNAKRITLGVIANPSFPNVKIEVINTWKTIPSVKSYDSIGVLFNGGFNVTNAYGYQKYNGTSVYYSYGGSNMVLKSNGVSISQDIVDSTTSGLSNELWVIGSFTSEPYQLTASYQHAVNNISLATSKNFNFSSSGMGRVFAWNSSYSNWDNMQGVCANLSSGGSSGILWYC